MRIITAMGEGGSTVLAAETVIVSALLVGFVLAFTLRRLQRARPDFDVRTPMLVAFGLRLLAAAGLSAAGLSSTLRGGDENTFLTFGQVLADSPIGHGFLPHGPFQLHTVLFAVEIKYGGFSEGALRVTQIGIALLGVLLIVAAVHDLAGARASRLAAWILAFEPASIFFNSGLSKEPLMVLAGGLVVYGGTKVWRHLDLSGILIMGLGGLIAVETRPYAGWFLISASALLILHAGVRRLNRPLRAMPLVYGVILAAFIAAPSIIQATSEESLKRLQMSQDYTTQTQPRNSGGRPNANNLALERVDFSTREAVFANLPQRIFDVVSRPYPWQVQNASQRLGAAGSLVAITCLVMLVGAFWRCRGRVLALAGPILYPLFFLLIAYSLSAGNAGTGFRYRAHIVTLALATLLLLRERSAHPEAVAATPASDSSRRATPHEAGPPLVVAH